MPLMLVKSSIRADRQLVGKIVLLITNTFLNKDNISCIIMLDLNHRITILQLKDKSFLATNTVLYSSYKVKNKTVAHFILFDN